MDDNLKKTPPVRLRGAVLRLGLPLLAVAALGAVWLAAHVPDGTAPEVPTGLTNALADRPSSESDDSPGGKGLAANARSTADEGIDPLALDDLRPAPAISVAEMAAGYQMNAKRFKRSRITWCNVEYVSPAMYHQWVRDTSKSLNERATGATDPGERQKASREARRFENLVPTPETQTSPARIWYWMDNWTDGRRLQLRSPKQVFLQGNGGNAWRFSDDPVTPVSLLTTYADYRILSFRPDAQDSVRCWRGNSSEPPYFEAFTADRIGAIEPGFTDYKFPPLLAPPSSENEAAIHPVDRVWSDFDEDLTVLGATELNGRKVYVVERGGEFLPRDGAPESGNRGRVVNRMFVDPEQGYLPLRVEYGFIRVIGGHQVDKKPIVDFLLECSEVVRAPNGGFYPTKGACTELMFDTTAAGGDQLQARERCFEDGTSRPKMVLSKRENWTVEQVVPDPEMSDAMFDLEFPNGTRYVDLTTRQEHLVGAPDAESVPNRLLESLYGKSRPELAITDARGVAKNVKLADYRGKWVLIDFWGLSCGPCIEGLSQLSKFYREHAADRDRFEILAVCYEGDEVRTMKEFDSRLAAPIIKDHWSGEPLPFPVLIDGDGKTLKAYGIDAVPTQVLIDPEGNLVKDGDERMLEEKLKLPKP